MKYLVLFDVGGTGLKVAICLNNSFEILVRKDFPSYSKHNEEILLSHFCNIVDILFKEIDLNICDIDFEIAMAFPGPFDYKKGISYMKGLSKYDCIYNKELPILLNDYFFKIFKVKPKKYYFIHDVESYALGVMDFYKIEDKKTIFLAIGTGAGSAYSKEGKIIKSGFNVPSNGWLYSLQFKESIIDDYISVRGLEKLSQKYLEKKLSPLCLSKLSIQGNERAKLAYTEFGENLCDAIIPLIEGYKAECFVLGGNISKSSFLFIEKFEKYLNKQNIKLIIETNTSQMIFRGLFNRGNINDIR